MSKSNDLAKRIEEIKKREYKRGNRDGMKWAIDTCKLAFFVAMNKELEVGKDRFENVLKCVNSIFIEDIVDDPEHARSKLERECERLLDGPVEQIIDEWRI